ncbi:MAG: hypothetical protein WCR52_22415 [Bacteroidota bacterium]
MRSLFFILFLSTFFSAPLSAQSHFPARDRGWVTFGIDGGLAFQTGDVRPSFNGYGGGLTLAKNLAYRPGGALSFDLRGRFLLSRTYGLDTKRSYGILRNPLLTNGPGGVGYKLDTTAPNDSSFVYQNYRHGMGELGLEGVLTFNRLRERTGIVLSLFGGLGVDVFRTKMDQYKENGDIYNYFSIPVAGSNATVKSDLKNLRDGIYETTAIGLTTSFMPDLGLELGYQLTPHFMIGVGHKITFSRTDLLDGQEYTDDNQFSDWNDIHHYTNLHLRWDIERHEHKIQPPVIQVIEPQGNPYVTRNSSEPLRARIRNVRNYADLECYLNGNNQPYSLNGEQFVSNLRLHPGRNEVRIVASNPAGKDEAHITVVMEDRVVVVDPPAPRKPEVRIVEPSRSPFTTDRPEIGIVATFKNIKDARDIRFTVNGREERFSLAENLEASAHLQEGRNVIRVEASNPAGSASDEVEVMYRRAEPQGQRPVVTITQPRNRTESTNNPTFTLMATVEHVDNRDDIVLYFNGNTQRDFNYDARSGRITAELRLRQGDNDVTVRARNRFGEGEASATIVKKDNIVLNRKPEVNITDPKDGATVQQEEITLRATLKNVQNKEQLVLIENGVAVRNFEFDSKAQTLRAALRLRTGDNILTVRATNADGTDEASVKVNYEQPKPKPTVRITDPAASTSTSAKPAYAVQAATENVATRNDVTCEVNRIPVPFNFDSRTGVVRLDATLREGDNIVSVKVSNVSGSNQASCTIRYEAAQKPEVTILTPENDSITKSFLGELNARTRNVKDKSELTVLLNDKPVIFNFNNLKQQITASLTFAEGVNTVRVRAKTAGGEAEAISKIRYLKARPPVVTIIEPKDKSVTDQPKVKLTAKVENILGKKSVQLRVNKSVVPNFEIDKAGNMTAELILNAGPNVILISANTPDGDGQASVEITYTPAPPVAKPQITFIQPGRPGSTVKTQLFAVKASITSVSSKDQIKCLINGTDTKTFSFDGRSHTASIEFLLKDGKNTINFEATNSAGTTSAQTDVTFAKSSVSKPELKIESVGQPVVSPFNPNVASTKIFLSVKNIEKKEQIKIKLNDLPVTNFNFDPTTGKLDVSVSLKRGSNPVVVRAENEAGSAEVTTTVKFE